MEDCEIDILEEQIPLLAEKAVKAARAKTLAAGRCVVEALDGSIVRTHPDGTRTLLKTIPMPRPVIPGQRKLLRK